MAPVVDGLEREYEGKVAVRRINDNVSEETRELKITVLPTYVFLDSSGEVMERQEGGNPQKLEEAFRRAAGE